MKSKNLIPSVNFHLWEPCNFACKFCFASFQDVKKSILPRGHLPREQALQVVEKLANTGFRKITFAGGEPTLCPWIKDLIKHAKARGLITMIVTNGTGITPDFMEGVKSDLDWVVLSIDSALQDNNKSIGRYSGTHLLPDRKYYIEKVRIIKAFEKKLKVNSVINKRNLYEHELPNFISFLQPVRWKLLQPLRIGGQNDAHFGDMEISKAEFAEYMERYGIKNLPFAVIEDNEAMTNSYIMVDPAGRFFDNVKGEHTYSEPILKVGTDVALKQISFDYELFLERGGLYEF